MRALAAPVVRLIGAFHGICSVAPISGAPAWHAKARIIKGMPPPRRQSVKGRMVIGVCGAVFRQRADTLRASFIKGRCLPAGGGASDGGQTVHDATDRSRSSVASNPIAVRVCANSQPPSDLLFTPVEKPVDKGCRPRKGTVDAGLRVFAPSPNDVRFERVARRRDARITQLTSAIACKD